MANLTEARTLHFDLSSWPAAAVHTMFIGGQQIPLQAHTAATIAQYKQSVPLLAHIPTRRLTHFVANQQFNAGAIQSYYITHPGPEGKLPNLSLGGILVPKAVANRAHAKYGAAKGPFAGKMKALALSVTPVAGDSSSGSSAITTSDLSDFQDTTDAALFVVYHHPNLITVSANDNSDGSGSDVAIQIMQIIQSTPAFANLATVIGEQGAAQDPNGVNAGNVGWANAEVWPNQQNVPVGQQQWWYTYTDETNAAALPVIQQALKAVRNESSLDGKSFTVDYGSHNTVSATASGSSAGQPQKAGSVLVRDDQGGSGSGYTFNLSDPDFNHGRQIVLSNTGSGRTITFTVNNSYFRHLGVFVRFLDDKGPLKLSSLGSPWNQSPAPANWTDYDAYMGYVVCRDRWLGIPTESAESEEITVTIPDGASGMSILCGGMGVGSLPSDYTEYAGVQVPGALMTGILDLGLPVFFLLLGATEDKIGASNFTGLITWIVETFAPDVAISAFNEGDASKSSLVTEWAGNILQSVITEAPEAFTSLLDAAMKEAGQEAALSWVPVAGTAFKALNILGTLVEITETVADIALSPWVIPNTLTMTMDVPVTIKHDPKDYQFPASATDLQITLSMVDAQPQVYTQALSGSVSEITHVFRIPAGGTFTVTASCTDSKSNGWVAASGTSGPVIAAIPQGQASLCVCVKLTENPYPINNKTQYIHKQVLGPDSNGGRQWISPSPAPSSTFLDLKNGQSVELDDLASITINCNGRLGYAWSGKSPALLQAGTTDGSTSLYTLQNINLDPASSIDADLRILGRGSQAYGYTAPIYIEYDPLGTTSGMHFIVAPAVDPTTNATEYHAFKVALDGATAIDLQGAQSYGRFASQRLDAIAVHPRGYVLALNAAAEKVEILKVPAVPSSISDANYATQTGGQGSYTGLLHGSRALAITKDGNTFLVLEGVNQRIQAFSVSGGTSVNYFGGGKNPYVDILQAPGDQGKSIVWLDMSVDPTGYIFVLSYDTNGPVYRMDVYGPDGKYITRTTGVNAARLTVDPFRAVYTANYSLLTPAISQRPEPTVSLWVGSQT